MYQVIRHTPSGEVVCSAPFETMAFAESYLDWLENQPHTLPLNAEVRVVEEGKEVCHGLAGDLPGAA